ncbi:UNVERIFIED_CONTAM: hypothetical protein GTU68_050671 [Idotea baltica]|nr:hypothetical protein [Idotea baltica]
MGLALLVAIFEFVNECRDIAKEDELPFLHVLMKELRFVLECKGSVKPVKKKAEPEDEELEEETNDIYGSGVYNYGLKNPPT